MSAEKSKKTPDKRRKYDDAFKAEALRLAAESRSTQAAAQQLGISPKLLYRWQEAKLVAEVGSVEVARDPEVRQLCQVLRVAPSAYYAWQRRQAPVPELAWQVAVRAEFKWYSARYGTRRLRVELQAQGYPVGRWRIRRALAAAGLRAQQPRSFVPRTTDSDPSVCAAPNLLLGQPAPTAPNQVWVGDITYLPKQGGGWLYLATWLDRYSRKIVGWDVREAMPEDLVSEALRRALAVRQPLAGLIVHSDQGSQYSASNFKALVARHQAVQSMSRRGNCYDNAHAESFWSRLKTELLDGGSFRNLTEARLEISHYLAYYNAERRHSARGYLAPNHFETHFQTTSQLCAAY